MEKLKSCSAFVVFNTEYLSLSRSESFLVEREREIRATAVSTIVSKWRLLRLWYLIAELDREWPSGKYYAGRTGRPSHSES